MVVVLSDKSRIEAVLVRDALRRAGLPCAVSLTDISTAMVNITFSQIGRDREDSDKYIYADAEAILDSATRERELRRICGRVSDVFFVKYGYVAGCAEAGAILLNEVGAKYFGKSIYLTETEKRIVVMLILGKSNWIKADDICEFCLNDADSLGAVSVHINNINRKSRLCSPIKMISSIRNSGYRLAAKDKRTSH